MRTTVTLDDALLAKARELSDIQGTSALIQEAVQRMVQQESARRLALLGGSEPDLTDIPRRREGSA